MSNSITINRQRLEFIKMFFKSYHNFHNKLSLRYVQSDKSRIKSFLISFGSLNKVIQKALVVQAPDFNLFKIMRIQHYEAWMHTPLLRELIDPKGTHLHEKLFFNLLLQELFGNKTDNVSEIQVYAEFGTPYGIIDLFIKYKQDERTKYIVIENKIYAADQENQLLRYFYYLNDHLNIPQPDFIIIYLTPEGTTPNAISISQDKLEILISEKLIYLWSYRNQISKILTQASSYIVAPSVSETIKQYINLIKTL